MIRCCVLPLEAAQELLVDWLTCQRSSLFSGVWVLLLLIVSVNSVCPVAGVRAFETSWSTDVRAAHLWDLVGSLGEKEILL